MTDRLWRWRFLWLAGLALLIFHRVLTASFLSDDYVLLNALREQGVVKGLGSLFLALGTPFLRPLVAVSLAMDQHLWGVHAWGYHLTNILLHTLCGFLVGQWAWNLIRSGATEMTNSDSGKRWAMALAALFIVLPCHGEVVCWISGRSDLLASVLGLGSLVLAQPALTGSAKENEGHWIRPLGSWLLFAAALLAKESVIFIPLWIALASGLAAWTGGAARMGSILHAVRRSYPYALITIAYFALRKAWLGVVIGGYGAARHLDFHPAMVAQNMVRALVRVFLPPLAPGSLQLILTAIFLAAGGLGLMGFFIYRKLKPSEPAPRLTPPAPLDSMVLVLYGSGFLLALFPVINLALALTTGEGERFLYLPSAFAVLLLGLAAGRLARRGLPLRLAAWGVGMFFAATLMVGNENWRQAGHLADSLLQTLGARLAAQEKILVLNAPDSLNGADIFRNGLDEATAWRGWARTPGTLLALPIACRLNRVDDPVTVQCQGPALTLAMAAPRTMIYLPEERREAMRRQWGITTAMPDPKTIQVTIPEAIQNGRVMLYYSAGQWHPLSMGQ